MTVTRLHILSASTGKVHSRASKSFVTVGHSERGYDDSDIRVYAGLLAFITAEANFYFQDFYVWDWRDGSLLLVCYPPLSSLYATYTIDYVASISSGTNMAATESVLHYLGRQASNHPNPRSARRWCPTCCLQLPHPKQPHWYSNSSPTGLFPEH